MTTPSRPCELEQRLNSLREQQAELAASGQGDGAAMRALARDIASAAAGLGFDAEEAAAIAGQIDEPASAPGASMAGEYRVLRGSTEPILTVSVLVIAAAVIGLGQPAAGAGMVVVAVASWIVHGARRVARLRIDRAGAPSFPGHLEAFEPSELLGLDFAYRYPPFVAENQKAASETVDLRLRLTGGRTLRLARGPLWRVTPRREPIAWYLIERSLRAYVRAAGLTIETVGAGWAARRG